jgi:hypothetical protein
MTTQQKASPSKRKPSTAAGARRRPQKSSTSEKWSKRVAKHSDAMDLAEGVFKLKSPGAIARSLKKSSAASSRRKSTPFRSAMSMLNFEINRAGSNLTEERRRVLNAAKSELRKVFDRPARPA